MTALSEIMSTDVQTLAPEDSLRRAAEQMESLDVGALPVCSGQRLLGMLTDRDIVVRAIAEGLDPDEACVSDIMSDEVQTARADEDSEAAMRLMGERQIRRLPVVDEDQRLVGIVSLADLALRQSGHIDPVVREISEPGT